MTVALASNAMLLKNPSATTDWILASYAVLDGNGHLDSNSRGAAEVGEVVTTCVERSLAKLDECKRTSTGPGLD